jgi:probable DNA metabolism protein
MYAVRISRQASEDEFREVARRCLAAERSPNAVMFIAPDEATLLPDLPDLAPAYSPPHVPRVFMDLLRDAICHHACDRFHLLYDLLWRTTHGEQQIATRAADPVVARLNDYARAVRRDIHKMHAFLRFRATAVADGTLYTAWFEPQHYILRRASAFFVDRFANMDWLIGTPQGSALWRDGSLVFGPPGEKPEAVDDAVLDEIWLTYYRTTFNPARLRLKAMAAEMPRQYWNNMPETAIIPDMIAKAEERVVRMREQDADQPPRFSKKLAARATDEAADIPREPLARLRAEAETCTRCPLYKNATQTVFGEGPQHARVVFVGEQPGDREDLAGKPFVGPAGTLFDRALEEAGISRKIVYVTNAVKHFKYEPRGKKRIHQKPNAGEVRACKWWLERELASIKPALVVALGATAAQSLAGHSVSVTRMRGPADFHGQSGYITVHPSFLLRIPEPDRKAAEYRNFVADLKRIRALMEKAEKAA